MKTEIIIPEFPFIINFNKGYISINNQKRKIIQLYNIYTQKRKTMSYARYRLSVLLRRELNWNEEADHIDNDKTNDCDSNLQVLTKEQNLNKEKDLLKKTKWVIFNCPKCNKSAMTRASQFKLRSKNGTRIPYCSRSCSSSDLIDRGLIPSISINTNNALSIEKVNKIWKLKSHGLSNRKIAKQVNVSRESVSYYCKNFKIRD